MTTKRPAVFERGLPDSMYEGAGSAARSNDGTDAAGWTRRKFIGSTAVVGVGLVACRGSAATSEPGPGTTSLAPELAGTLEERFAALMTEHGVTGCSAALVRESDVIWSRGFGIADLDTDRPMTPESLINVGSVTKTLTTTAILQLVESGRLDLDGDVSEIVSFPLRNPNHSDQAITTRQLLAHRSSIRDGEAYDESYACGDRVESLGDWLGRYFSSPAEDAYHTWAPGELEPPPEPRAYSNVGYGLLGHVVEAVTGESYEDYCRRAIFEPLGMTASGFRIDRIDETRHAVPYSNVGEEVDLDELDEASTLSRFSFDERPPTPGEPFAHCLYSFATPPDGLWRASVLDMCRFTSAWIGGGETVGAGGGPVRILATETTEMATSETHFGRMLCWERSGRLPGEPLIYHDGGDPGIAAFLGYRPLQRTGLAIQFNTSDPGPMFGAAIRAMLEALDA